MCRWTPDYPAERLAFMLEDSGARILLTHEALRERLPHTVAQTLCLDTEQERLARQLRTNPECTVSPHHLAYVIYTSGSTGRPKGVAIEHHSPSALIEWAQSVWPRDELSGVLAGTSICFDLSVFEIFLPLSVGGAVILARNVLEVPHIKLRDRVTLINTVPSAIGALLRQNALPASVRVVNLAGEPLTSELADRVYAVAKVENSLRPVRPIGRHYLLHLKAARPGSRGHPSAGRSPTRSSTSSTAIRSPRRLGFLASYTSVAQVSPAATSIAPSSRPNVHCQPLQRDSRRTSLQDGRSGALSCRMATSSSSADWTIR